MIRENLFYKILSAIHIVFFTSILCFGTIFLTGTLLMIPAFSATFLICKDYLSKKLDINNSIIKTYYGYLKVSMKLAKFIPVNLIMILNIFGMIWSMNTDNIIYSILCLSITTILLLLAMYIAGYHTFVDEHVDVIEVAISIILKPQYVLPVFCILVLLVCFFSFTVMIILLVSGAFFLFALSVLILITMLHYRKAIGKLEEEDEFAYLIQNVKKRK